MAKWKRRLKEIERKKERANQEKEREKKAKRQRKLSTLNRKIIKLLKVKEAKIPASDIDAFLKHQNVDEIKKLCEQMYHNGKISRTSNYRYFILTEEQKKPKKTLASNSTADKLKEIKVLVDLFEDGTLTKEIYLKKIREKLK